LTGCFITPTPRRLLLTSLRSHAKVLWTDSAQVSVCSFEHRLLDQAVTLHGNISDVSITRSVQIRFWSLRTTFIPS
jgi:hypothetical protein